MNGTTQTHQDALMLSVRDLHTYIYTNNRCNKAVSGVSFDIHRGRTLCIVGESGCGKSVTAASIMRLLPELSRIEQGEIVYHGRSSPVHIEQLAAKGSEMRALRGADLAMIFQDPMTALNPAYSIGFQIGEVLRYHTDLTSAERRNKVIQLLRDMGIPLPEQRVDEYPHQYSGGMRQRAMIAMAMACNPHLLIADEPTTALDVTIQAQIFELMNRLKTDYDTAILLITHDMGVVAELADEVAVMYMGNIVESGTVSDILTRPRHPYTRALLDSIPVLGRGRRQRLQPIRGTTPDTYMRPPGCQFAPRCDAATAACNVMPGERQLTESQSVRCWHPQETGSR